VPELPEVETIIRRLRDGDREHPPVIGHRIQSVEIAWDRIIAEPDPASFKQALVGKAITGAQRRAKFLHFPLNHGHLVGHLRMSGDMRMVRRFDIKGNPIPKDPYDQVMINFESNWRMTFSSIRKFGRMWYTEDLESIFGKLGPEPLSENFKAEQLYEMLHAHSRQIKPLLLDQHFIAGLGNIYTDESLFRAMVHPLRRSDSLSKAETQMLFNAIRLTLTEGILNFGASLDWIYRGGEFQNFFKVYKRQGQPCPVCGTEIKKITVGQRGTHLCPNCQRLPSSAVSGKQAKY
jgi:formamidopyrimidine-DNA glycosylase